MPTRGRPIWRTIPVRVGTTLAVELRDTRKLDDAERRRAEEAARISCRTTS